MNKKDKRILEERKKDREYTEWFMEYHHKWFDEMHYDD